MPGSITGKVQPWFTINEFLSESLAAATDKSIEKITAVAFDVDVNITIGGLASAFPLPAYTPLGIDSSTSTIQIDADAFMFVMGGR